MIKKTIKIVEKILETRAAKRAGWFFIFLVLFFIFSYFAYAAAYNGKFYPGIKIGELDLTGQTPEEAHQTLETKIGQGRDKNLQLFFQDKKWEISPSQLQLKYDLDKTISTLFALGHHSSFWQNFRERISLLFRPRSFLVSFSYDKNTLDQTIDEITAEIAVPLREATLEVANGQITLVKEQTGRLVLDEQLKKSITGTIGALTLERTVSIETETQQPRLKGQDILAKKLEIERLLSSAIILKSDFGNFQASGKVIGSWLEIVIAKTKAYAEEESYFLSYIFNQNKTEAYIESIAQKINKDPKDAKLTIAGGRATVFQVSQDGYELDQTKTLAEIENILSLRRKVAGVSTEADTASPASEISLAIRVQKPAISNETVDNLGIKELIGSGTTSFVGSPENRKYNIKLGASIFNGAMIKPGQEFSFLSVLGDVSEERGFKKELVIKEDRTEPEVGGGLCQVSTTMFRAALNSGLEITERTNHKYRVSYYEPPVGMDATVYEPAPDLKFKNNTPGYILIQSKISGNNLTFEFYGTKDGRKVEISDPLVYDRTDPPEPVYVDDPSLAPGEVKQVEKAHQGAKASFHYKVTAREGKVLSETTFYSTYVAWRAVYLRGPQEEFQPEPSPSPTPTPTPTPEPSVAPTSTPSP